MLDWPTIAAALALVAVALRDRRDLIREMRQYRAEAMDLRQENRLLDARIDELREQLYQAEHRETPEE